MEPVTVLLTSQKEFLETTVPEICEDIERNFIKANRNVYAKFGSKVYEKTILKLMYEKRKAAEEGNSHLEVTLDLALIGYRHLAEKMKQAVANN